MRPDFSLIWGADNAPFTAIEASDYAAGWVFRTGAPPRRVNFDYFQNLSDQRTAWLGEQMLLAVGHEWQDDVTYDEYAIVRSPVNGQLYRSLVGGNLGNEPSASGAQWAIGVQPQSADYLNTTRIDVASASNVNLTSSAPNTRHINITGTTAITGFTVAAGECYFVRFAGALTLTNGAGLVTQTGKNITTAAGDTCIIRATAANVVEVLCFTRVKQFYESQEQTITAGGQLVLAHGLGVAPKFVSAFLVCKVAELGYSVGDVVAAQATATDASGSYGLSTVVDSTNITLRYGSTAGALLVLNKTNGGTDRLTNVANWRLIVRAQA